MGRTRELVEIKQILDASPLLTLTGAGGAGKTRLALEAARQLLPEFPDGAWFVDLAALSDSSLVPQVVASTLGLQEDRRRSVETVLVESLQVRRLLLVLDNCEHLLPAIAESARALLLGSTHLRVLATSRERLGVPGERV